MGRADKTHTHQVLCGGGILYLTCLRVGYGLYIYYKHKSIYIHTLTHTCICTIMCVCMYMYRVSFHHRHAFKLKTRESGPTSKVYFRKVFLPTHLCISSTSPYPLPPPAFDAVLPSRF